MSRWILVFAATPLFGQVGLGLSPLRISLPMKPGQVYTDSLVLDSPANTMSRIRSETLDFYIDGEQEPQFGQFASENQSCRPFLRVNPTDFELAANGHTLVRYTLAVPAGANPGTYYCAAGFTTFPTPSQGESGIVIKVRMVATFYITVGTPQLNGGLKALTLEPDPSDPAGQRRAICVLTNPGAFVWRPEGVLELRSPDGNVVQSMPFRSAPVLPGRDQRFVFPLKQPPASDSELAVRVDIGNGEIQEGYVAVSKLMAR